MARHKPEKSPSAQPVIRVRRIHRRDLNRVWEFLKKVFRLVNRETVEYQRPRTKTRFLEIYEEEGIEQLLFEVHEAAGHHIVGYAECAYEVIGSDNWINERYFDNRDMRPLFVEEIAIHPDYQGRGIGSFVIEQLEHLARVHGCTHLVLEVAANNKRALQFYRARSFAQLDAAIFLAKKVISEPELLPPRALRPASGEAAAEPAPEDTPEAAPELAALVPELPAAEPPARRRAKQPDLKDMPEKTAGKRRRAKEPAREDMSEPPAGERRRAKKPAREDMSEPPASERRDAEQPAQEDMSEAPASKRRRAAAPKTHPAKAARAPAAPAKARVAARRVPAGKRPAAEAPVHPHAPPPAKKRPRKPAR